MGHQHSAITPCGRRAFPVARFTDICPTSDALFHLILGCLPHGRLLCCRSRTDSLPASAFALASVAHPANLVCLAPSQLCLQSCRRRAVPSRPRCAQQTRTQVLAKGWRRKCLLRLRPGPRCRGHRTGPLVALSGGQLTNRLSSGHSQDIVTVWCLLTFHTSCLYNSSCMDHQHPCLQRSTGLRLRARDTGVYACNDARRRTAAHSRLPPPAS